MFFSLRKPKIVKTRDLEDIVDELEPNQQSEFNTRLDTIINNYDGPNAIGMALTEYLFLKLHELETELNKLKEEKGEE